MAQAQVEMAVAIAWAAWEAEAEAKAAWLRLQPSPEGGLQPSLGRTTWRATELRLRRGPDVHAADHPFFVRRTCELLQLLGLCELAVNTRPPTYCPRDSWGFLVNSVRRNTQGVAGNWIGTVH